jgi:hypothetical protein
MKVVFRTRANETVTREFKFGSTSLVGLRIDELIVESAEELRKLLSEDEYIRTWVAKCVVPAFRYKPFSEAL